MVTVPATPNLPILSRPLRLLTGGEWVEVPGTFATINPATGETLAHVPEGREAEIDRAVAAARRAFEEGPWPAMSPAARARLLWNLADAIEARAEEFALTDSLDAGKPVWEARLVEQAQQIRLGPGLARAIKAGTIWINTYAMFDPAVPYGGYKRSGYGRELGQHALEAYTQTKSVWINLS